VYKVFVMWSPSFILGTILLSILYNYYFRDIGSYVVTCQFTSKIWTKFPSWWGVSRGQFFIPKTDLARQSSPVRLSLSLIDSLVFCLRLVYPTNPRDPHTFSMSQSSGITLINMNRMNNTADYRNKSQPFH